MDAWSQVSVKMSTKLAFTMLLVTTHSLSLSVLLAIELTLERKILGKAGLSGHLFVLANSPPMRPPSLLTIPSLSLALQIRDREPSVSRCPGDVFGYSVFT
jgi:hypothetical protein